MPWRTTHRCRDWAQVRRIAAGAERRLILKSATPPHEGTDVELRLELPDGTCVALTGRVTERVDGGAGVAVAIDLRHAIDLLLLDEMAAAYGAEI